jgi:hypothetical protein
MNQRSLRSREALASRHLDANLEAYATMDDLGASWRVHLTSVSLFREYIVEEYQPNRCTLMYDNRQTQHIADIDGGQLVFKDVPTVKEAQAILDLIDAILVFEQRASQLVSTLTERLHEMEPSVTGQKKLLVTGPEDCLDIIVCSVRSNVTRSFVRGASALVMFKSTRPAHLFEALMPHAYTDAEWDHVGQTNTLVFEDQEYSGVEHVEDDVYLFRFSFPDQMEVVRERVLMLARVLLTEV